MKLTRWFFLAVWLAPNAPAQMTFLSQTRYVEASASASQAQGSPLVDADRIDATDFGHFDESLTASVSSSSASGTATAEQTSHLSPSLISAEGITNATGGASLSSAFGSGTSTSSFEVTFEVTTTVDVTLSGGITYSQYGFVWVSLAPAQGGFLYDILPGPGPGGMPIQASMTLDPGQYVLLGDAFAAGSGDEWISYSDYTNFNVQLTAVPHPVGTSDCEAPSLNSNSTRATLRATGTDVVSSADLILRASGAIPGEAGLVFYGQPQVPVSFGGGTLCLGGALYRLSPVVQSDASGGASLPIDFNAWPVDSGAGAFASGSTWSFQYWYRDPGDPTGFSVSDRLTISFQ